MRTVAGSMRLGLTDRMEMLVEFYPEVNNYVFFKLFVCLIPVSLFFFFYGNEEEKTARLSELTSTHANKMKILRRT